MATKTISITEGAYKRLAALKRNKESFSDVINKVTAKHGILKLAGTLSNRQAQDLKKAITKIRKRLRQETQNKVREMK